MVTHHFLDRALAELLDEPNRLTLEELARSCCMAPGWVATSEAAAGCSPVPPCCAHAAWRGWNRASTPTPSWRRSRPT